MILNRNKRIGNVVIIAEGENPEFSIIENVFHNVLGYSVQKYKRSEKDIVELTGTDEYSKVTIINSPTNNINSIDNAIDFYDLYYKEVFVKLGIDLFTDSVYVLFDRDPNNNRYGTVKNLIEKLTESQNDSEEMNGLLLLNYPSIESFTYSLYVDKSYDLHKRLGSEMKEVVNSLNLNSKVMSEENLIHATNGFINFLIENKFLDKDTDLLDNLNVIGKPILDFQQEEYTRLNTFSCISQLVEILVDLQIIEF